MPWIFISFSFAHSVRSMHNQSKAIYKQMSGENHCLAYLLSGFNCNEFYVMFANANENLFCTITWLMTGPEACNPKGNLVCTLYVSVARQLMRFWPDSVWSNCLESQKKGITLRAFFEIRKREKKIKTTITTTNGYGNPEMAKDARIYSSSFLNLCVRLFFMFPLSAGKKEKTTTFKWKMKLN